MVLLWPDQQEENRLKYHAIVGWPDGRLEDPSLALGMYQGMMPRRPIFRSERYGDIPAELTAGRAYA
jgi:hypothetical protein